MKGLYSENYKTLMNKIEDDTHKWKDTPCSWTGRINIVKVSILPKEINRFNAVPVQIPRIYFTELEQIILKFISNLKRHQIATAIFRKTE